MVTTGPGFFNLITGIAACYYDNIPAVFLCGQVNKGINLAAKFGIKMYGFQEAPHSEIASFFSEKSIKSKRISGFRWHFRNQHKKLHIFHQFSVYFF